MPVAALAFSGGLDTSYAVLALRREGYEVVTVTIDTGGFVDTDLERLAERSEKLGARDHVTVDGRLDVYNRFFSYLIRGNVLRGAVYPVAVGAERVVQAEGLVRVARDQKASWLAHGCTGAGNDQVRFDVAFATLAPDMKVLAPIREKGVTRDAATLTLADAGVTIPDKTTRYSVNRGIVGATVGGGETHAPWKEIPEEAYRAAGSVLDPEAQEHVVVIEFEKGLPVALDGEAQEPLGLLDRLDRQARPLGIGRGMHLGDTILGIKGRIGFVAPAATVLIQAHRELEKLVLTKRQADFKNQAGKLYGDLLHEGLYFDPVCRDLEKLLDSSQEHVSGEVKVRLRPHRAEVVGARSPYSLVVSAARYGETSDLWDARDALGFARLYGLASHLAARKDIE
ncbi:MAG: argininosuccinate synthase [Planctomycetota bacterium]|nr:argininosuccinate synthase [Planctomycetota bacterium]